MADSATRVGDLGGGQTADSSQRQRHLRNRAERRQHRKSSVRLSSASSAGSAVCIGSSLTAEVISRLRRAWSPEQVDHSPVANPDQPAARVLRHPFGRPPLHRGEQRLLDGILGDLEVTESADQRAKHLRRFTAQQVLDANFVRGHRSVRFGAIVGAVRAEVLAHDRSDLNRVADGLDQPPGDLQGSIVARAVQHGVAGQDP